jgi:cell division protein FtsB
VHILRDIKIFLGSSKFYLILSILLLINLIFGFIYLSSLIEKIKLTDYNNQLIRQNNQLNADISRIKIEIDEKVDLANIEKISREDWNMVDIKEVTYIKIE